MAGGWYEDFAVGDVIRSAEGTLSVDDVTAFGRRYDPQPFHTDPEAAAASDFGGLIASGWQLGAFAFRLFMDTEPFAPGASLGSPGLEYLRWRRPVRPGDVLRVEVAVTDKRVSRSKPDRGLIGFDWRTYNGRGEEVMASRSIQIIFLRQIIFPRDSRSA